MTYIIDRLYMGGVDDACNTLRLKEQLGITHILTVDCKPISMEATEKFHYKYIHALDIVTEDVLCSMEESSCFIQDGRDTGGVLVHCLSGVSRSCTMVLAYIMHEMDLTLNDALKLVRTQRPQACPNTGFMEQLQLYEEMGKRIDENNIKYKAYKLQNLALQMQNAHGQALTTEFTLTADPTQGRAGETLYKCRKCRRSLFKGSGLMSHDEGGGENAFRRPWSVTSFGESVPCTQSLFVEPIEWMREQIMCLEGKLLCPKCKAKLGSFNWAGERCSCGRWITPAFHVAVNKVDLTKVVARIPVSQSPRPAIHQGACAFSEAIHQQSLSNPEHSTRSSNFDNDIT